jgi:cobalt/nickel transport system permease protein
MLLAVLLGPYAAFIAMASILTIQALFFADGGLLALGCNIINMGFFPCFIAFPLIYKRIAGSGPERKRILPAAMAASIIALQLGGMGVVTETFLSGISALSFKTFVLLMLPIHLVIGVVEGFVTATVIGFVGKSHPEVLEMTAESSGGGRRSLKPVIIALVIIAALTGGFLSWFASTSPDGLEWSVARSSGDKALPDPQGKIHSLFSSLQEKTAFLPDYGFRKDKVEGSATDEAKKGNDEPWPGVNLGTSVSGLLGGVMSLVLVGLIGLGIKTSQRRKPK